MVNVGFRILKQHNPYPSRLQAEIVEVISKNKLKNFCKLSQFSRSLVVPDLRQKLCGELLIDAGGSSGGQHEKGHKDEIGLTVDFDVNFDGDKAFEFFMDEEKKGAESNLSEIEKYLQATREEGRTLDILMWWNIAGQKFKILSLMARDILAIPVTTVASESTFSTSGRVLDGYRSSLTLRVVEALICAQDWLRVVNKPVNMEECIENAEKFESAMDDACSELTGK
ncbi:uncharacterized protein LOC125316004 [Rhodamnia argentea]|uniref:Uncharacterized protein LOC125316004 n=1 Tax=Rhodamnia argentea TaxID=178133 RepID=A0ABM3HPT7_9MYRT|nr:uncharacterized protein LOC125316004 [Rhodamnia argentea]